MNGQVIGGIVVVISLIVMLTAVVFENLYSFLWSRFDTIGAQSDYLKVIRGCTIFGLVVLCLTWFVTQGSLDGLILGGLVVSAIVWFVSFLMAIAIIIIRHFKAKTRIDSNLMFMPIRCICRCIVTFGVWWVLY